MCDIMQMFFVGFSIQIEWAAVIKSVAKFTHCWAVQLSELDSLVEECTQGWFFSPNELKSFYYSAHVCMYAWVPS